MELLKEIRLFILACSATKRKDAEIERMIQSDISLNTTTPLEVFSAYRQCTKKAYKHRVYKSKYYPACLRYNGIFYRQIPIKLWERIDKLPVLILSAYYGFLRPTDGISNYNLKISQVKTSCKRHLPALLKRYMNEYQFKEAVFLTSSNYFLPFKKENFAKRLHLYDNSGNEIIGPYGRDYYILTGRMFSNILQNKSLLSGLNNCFAEIK
ncbi:MAG: hypothetical protein DRP29_09700 [Thermodesulfobacteriota bacterium]|nr:MAG: hypothetical protein DRP29_09700 [Thermodesulfobacteriota bacterium]